MKATFSLLRGPHHVNRASLTPAQGPTSAAPIQAGPVRRAFLGASGLALLLFGLGACGGDSNGDPNAGKIPVPQSDATGPTLTLGVGSASVSVGGTGQPLTLSSRTGPLNVLATAMDNESGIQALQVWVVKSSTKCDSSGLCSGGPGGISPTPRWESSETQATPGQFVTKGSTMLQAFDLSQEVTETAPPGGTLTVTLEVWAVAINHLGGQVRTPSITATWSE
jgi:hypothetical protein